MKKLLLLLGLILILLIGCAKSVDAVAILTNTDTYTPAMSSIQGITMTPDFKTSKRYTDLVYHWTTEEGEFLDYGQEVENKGQSILWWAVENDELIEIEDSCEVKLEVIDSKSQKVLAETKLTIVFKDFLYRVER